MGHHRGRLLQLNASTIRWKVEIARKERLVEEAKREAIACLIADEEYGCLDVDWEQVVHLIEERGM